MEECYQSTPNRLLTVLIWTPGRSVSYALVIRANEGGFGSCMRVIAKLSGHEIRVTGWAEVGLTHSLLFTSDLC